ncbi:MAG: FUSC family protein [Adhaeribacter sp.]
MNKFIHVLTKTGLTLQTVKTAFAAAASWFVATNLLQSEYPYFAAVAAIITVQVTVADSVDKATQRIIGIIGGVLLSMLLGQWFQIGAISIFFIILIVMSVAKALRMNPQIISQVAISSLLVLAFGQTKEGYGYERIIETILGSAIAVIINALIIPQNAVPEVERSIKTYSVLASDTLNSLTALLHNTETIRKTGRSEVDTLLREAEKCQKTLELATQSLKYNLLLTHKRVRLSQLTESIHQLESITIQIRGIRRSLADLSTVQPIQLNPAYSHQLKQAMASTARCIQLYGDSAINASEENRRCLQIAIQEALTQQGICLNNLSDIKSLATVRDVGSILTDLGRIVTETIYQNLVEINKIA